MRRNSCGSNRAAARPGPTSDPARGLPGIVIACLADGPVTLIEPRRLRADFLHKVTESLALNASVFVGKAERAVGSST